MSNDKIKIKFDQARSLLKDGDVLLFRGQGLVSFLIGRAAEGKYSHVGVVSSVSTNGDIIWECIEFREGYGGRSINLEQYVKDNSGIIDVYRPSNSINVIYFDPKRGAADEYSRLYEGKKVTNIMRRMTGLPYGWRRIWWIAQHKLPILRLFYNIDSVVDDSTKDLIYPVCSTAVAYSLGRVGYDLLHHRADKAMEPSDVARSPLLHYLFTLFPEN